jgi:hypothetical protein
MAAPCLPLVEIPENTRHLQQVFTLSIRKTIILWMVEVKHSKEERASTPEQFNSSHSTFEDNVLQIW